MIIDWRENANFRARCRVWEKERLALRPEVDFLVGLDQASRDGGILAVEKPAETVDDPVCRHLLRMYTECAPEWKVARFTWKALMDQGARGAVLLRRFLYAQWVLLKFSGYGRQEMADALEGYLADSSLDYQPLTAEEIAILEAPLDFGGEGDGHGEGGGHA